MEDYRLYCVNETDHFFGCEEIQAESDAAAIQRSISLQGDHAAELWCGGRKIRTFKIPSTAKEAE